MEILPIAHIECDFDSKFGIPRQSGVVKELTARIVLAHEFRNPEAFRELDGFSGVRPFVLRALAETKGWESLPLARRFVLML